MKNKIIHTSIILALSMGMIACSNSSNSEDSNKTEESITEKAVDVVVSDKEIEITPDNFWDYFEVKTVVTTGSNLPEGMQNVIRYYICLKDEYAKKVAESKMEEGSVTFTGTFQSENATFNEDGSFSWTGNITESYRAADALSTHELHEDSTFEVTDTMKYGTDYTLVDNIVVDNITMYLPSMLAQINGGPFFYVHYTDVNVDSVDFTLWLKS